METGDWMTNMPLWMHNTNKQTLSEIVTDQENLFKSSNRIEECLEILIRKYCGYVIMGEDELAHLALRKRNSVSKNWRRARSNATPLLKKISMDSKIIWKIASVFWWTLDAKFRLLMRGRICQKHLVLKFKMTGSYRRLTRNLNSGSYVSPSTPIYAPVTKLDWWKKDY